MKIKLIIGHRHESYDGQYAPEVLDAWDEYCLDENYEGFTESLERQKSADCFASVAVVTLSVSNKDILAALYPKNEVASKVVDE